jgi:hypothetical protein
MISSAPRMITTNTQYLPSLSGLRDKSLERKAVRNERTIAHNSSSATNET